MECPYCRMELPYDLPAGYPWIEREVARRDDAIAELAAMLDELWPRAQMTMDRDTRDAWAERLRATGMEVG